MVASPEQLHSTFSYCLDFAKHMLDKCGEFLPFAAALTPSGEVKAIGGWTGEEHPAPAELYQLLSSALRSEAVGEKIIGSAVAVNVNIPSAYSPHWPDGIRVHLECDGYSRYVYVPYAITTSGWLKRKRDVSLADPFAVEAGSEIFTS
jgi:hypothetical protein